MTSSYAILPGFPGAFQSCSHRIFSAGNSDYTEIVTVARSQKPGRAPWVVLSLGFGGLLVFVLAAGWACFLILGTVQGDETNIRRTFVERLGAMDRIRSQIYLSGTYVRDFLLSPDNQGASAQAERLSALQLESRNALQTYGRGLEAEEREPFQALRAEIESYWSVLDRTLSWTWEERQRLRAAFFYNELVRRRTAMLQIADRISAVNERGLIRAEERLSASAEGLRRSLLVTFGITFIGGLILALLTIRSTLRLERELGLRFAESVRSRADLRELSAQLLKTQETERRTLARELHDEVGQSLSAILMETSGAESTVDPRRIQEHLVSIRILAEKTISEVRDIALLLRPSMLDDFGLVPALNWHAREMAKRSGMRIRLSAEDAVNVLPDEHKTCIYRLVQEALNNAVRHSGASAVEVAVRREGGQVECEISDDGVGFDARHTRGMGLLGMEERVNRLGGEFEIVSQPGHGATIRARLPLSVSTERIEVAASNSDR